MRALTIIGSLCVVAIIAGAALYFWSPSSSHTASSSGALASAAPAGKNVSFTVIDSGPTSPDSIAKGNYRITSADELTQLWGMIYGADAGKPPHVDFTKYEVLAVFDESHATGGYKVSVDSVTDASTSRVVVLHWESPADNCQVTQVVSAPYTIVTLPKTTLKLDHIDQSTVDSCS